MKTIHLLFLVSLSVFASSSDVTPHDELIAKKILTTKKTQTTKKTLTTKKTQTTKKTETTKKTLTTKEILNSGKVKLIHDKINDWSREKLSEKDYLAITRYIEQSIRQSSNRLTTQPAPQPVSQFSIVNSKTLVSLIELTMHAYNNKWISIDPNPLRQYVLKLVESDNLSVRQKAIVVLP
ncbi:MAG: hypothetical protein V2I33_07650, partial [Kangiellaceae bacterium]|nr:hypothetical protein [Kangiellaceae bacterium]